MAEQVSFYDKLKSDMGEEISEAETRRKREAAARFASSGELAADPRLFQDFAYDATEPPPGLNRAEADARINFRGLDTVSDEAGNTALAKRRIDRMDDTIAQLLRSEAGQTKVGFRSSLLEAKRELADILKRSDFRKDDYGGTLDDLSKLQKKVERMGRSSYTGVSTPGNPRADIDAHILQAKGRLHSDPVINQAEIDYLKATQEFNQLSLGEPLSASDDRAIATAAEKVRAAGRQKDDAYRAAEARKASRRPPRAPGALRPDPQLALSDVKQMLELRGTEAVSAAKKALGSPALKRGLAVGAGILGSKAGMAATSGGADLVAELAVGVPKAFIEGYNRSQEPYEQVKYVAEAQGPIDKLHPKTLSSLGYSDALRLRDEGHLTSGAVEQLRQHVTREEGFDPQRVLRDMDRSVTSGSR